MIVPHIGVVYNVVAFNAVAQLCYVVAWLSAAWHGGATDGRGGLKLSVAYNAVAYYAVTQLWCGMVVPRLGVEGCSLVWLSM